MVAVAGLSRHAVAKGGKIRCHPKIAFVRENLVRRVARQSPRFSAPSPEGKRRAHASKSRRGCIVREGSWPNSREFPVPGMEVADR